MVEQCRHDDVMGYQLDNTNSTSRRVIDHAIGILVGLRGCSPEQAFAELVEVMERTGLGIGTISAELVSLAAGAGPRAHVQDFGAWADLVELHRTLVTWPARHRAS